MQNEDRVTLGIFFQLLEPGAAAVTGTPNEACIVGLGKHSCPPIFAAINVLTTTSSFLLTVVTSP